MHGRSDGSPFTTFAFVTAPSASMMMERRDVAALERSRDYADIDPELAWEQWEIVRAMRAML